MPKDITKNDKKEKKESKHFFKDFKAELKRVIWPTPKQLVNNTVAVIVIVLITAAIVFVLDLVFELVNDYGIDKLRTFVDSHTEQNENTVNNTETENVVNETSNSENAEHTHDHDHENEDEHTHTTDNTEKTNTVENSQN